MQVCRLIIKTSRFVDSSWKREQMATGPQTKMLLVYVGSGEDQISQKCEHSNKVSKADTTWYT